MATRKSRIAISLILMITMVSFFSIPASVFAETDQGSAPSIISDQNTEDSGSEPSTFVDQVDQNLDEPILEASELDAQTFRTLNVSYGGVAIYNGKEYTPGSYSLGDYSGDIKAYSNAGYSATNGVNIYKVTGSEKSITVGFTKMPDVYGIPYYVTDGYFSGYEADGTDIAKGHDPKGDVLAATMTATPTTSVYALGTTANISLNVSVTKGDDNRDGDTKQLNEVDFYENGLNKQTFPSSPGSNPVKFATTIPTSESALVGAGFVLTTDGIYKIYTKTLNYDLVDRYNTNGGAAILATAKAYLVVKIEKPINLWVASDDRAIVYIDGTKSTDDSSYATASKYAKDVTDDTFVAAKAWDTDGTANIAGFKLVLKKNNGDGYLSTNPTWYYYNKFNGNPPTGDWFKKDYIALASDWSPVTSFTLEQAPLPRNWAPDSDFPGTSATWIWSPNFDVPTSTRIDTPVYLRSMAPTPPPVPVGHIIVTKTVVGSNTDQEFSFTMGDETFTLQNKGTKTFDVTPGSYTVTESTGEGFTTAVNSLTGSAMTQTVADKGTIHFDFVNTFPIIDPPPVDPKTGTITVKKNVIDSNGKDITDNASFEFTYKEYVAPTIVNEASVALVEAPLTVSEDSDNVIKDLPYGTYVFTETDVADDAYTDITPNGSVTVTINGDNPNGTVLFTNEYKVPDVPVIPDVPKKHHDETVVVQEVPTPAGPVVSPVVPVNEETTPGAPVTTLPKTGGLDPSFLYGLGALLAGSGIVLKRRKK